MATPVRNLAVTSSAGRTSPIRKVTRAVGRLGIGGIVAQFLRYRPWSSHPATLEVSCETRRRSGRAGQVVFLGEGDDYSVEAAECVVEVILGVSLRAAC